MTSEWKEFNPNELPHERIFHQMDWLRWKPTRQGGLISDPIIEDNGSAAWVKSKLLRIDINADVTECNVVNLNLKASRVSISPTECHKLQSIMQSTADQTTKQLIHKLKLNSVNNRQHVR